MKWISEAILVSVQTGSAYPLTQDPIAAVAIVVVVDGRRGYGLFLELFSQIDSAFSPPNLDKLVSSSALSSMPFASVDCNVSAAMRLAKTLADTLVAPLTICSGFVMVEYWALL